MGLNIKQIRETINKWKQKPEIQTIYKNKERFKPEHFEELDLELTPKLVETLNINAYGQNIKMNNKIMVYIPYHNLWFALREIDPTVKFDYEVLDFNAGIKTDLGYKVNGLSILVEYHSTYLPEQTQHITLAITDNKYSSIEIDKIKADDIEYTAFRAFVKTIAFNTGIGYLCWLNPEWVKKAGFLNSPSTYTVEDWFGNEQATLQMRQQLVSKKQAMLATQQAEQVAQEEPTKLKRTRTPKAQQPVQQESVVTPNVVEQQPIVEPVAPAPQVIAPTPIAEQPQQQQPVQSTPQTINDSSVIDVQFKNWLMENLESKKVIVGNYLQQTNKKTIMELTPEEKLALMKG